MSDNHRRYCGIRDALVQLSPHLKGHAAKHRLSLAAIICGIVGSKHSQLPAIASKAPSRAKRQSRIMGYARWLHNQQVTVEQYFLPFGNGLLESLPEGPLVLVMDGSQVGRGCMALVVSVLHQRRALPLAWLVVKANKGHLSQELHLQRL